jgi:hypothetical protein
MVPPFAERHVVAGIVKVVLEMVSDTALVSLKVPLTRERGTLLLLNVKLDEVTSRTGVDESPLFTVMEKKSVVAP